MRACRWTTSGWTLDQVKSACRAFIRNNHAMARTLHVLRSQGKLMMPRTQNMYGYIVLCRDLLECTSPSCSHLPSNAVVSHSSAGPRDFCAYLGLSQRAGSAGFFTMGLLLDRMAEPDRILLPCTYFSINRTPCAHELAPPTLLHSSLPRLFWSVARNWCSRSAVSRLL